MPTGVKPATASNTRLAAISRRPARLKRVASRTTPSEAEQDQEIGRQQQAGDGLRQDEEHQRVFFQAS